MNKPIARSFLFFLLLTLSFGALSSSPRLALSQLLSDIKTMQADFKQTVHSERGKILQQTTGKMAISRPGRFRWSSQLPTEQLIIADGKTLWLYDIDLEQVTVKAQKQTIGGSPAAFLSGDSQKVMENYSVLALAGGQFQLLPKNTSSDFESIRLTFKDKKLVKMQLTDKLGQQTQLVFTAIRVNHSLSKQLFQFQIPRGVDVIR